MNILQVDLYQMLNHHTESIATYKKEKENGFLGEVLGYAKIINSPRIHLSKLFLERPKAT